MKKLLKKVVVVVVSIIAMLLITAIFVKKDYTVEREITISKSNEEVFSYVKHIKNQDQYSVWTMLDPSMKKDFRGTDGTVGFVYAWDGNDKAGKGEQEIKELTEGKAVNMELRFKKPMESIAYAHMITEAVSDNETKLKWGMKGHTPYPMNLVNLFIDGLLGKDLEASLVNLKTVMEGNNNPIAVHEKN